MSRMLVMLGAVLISTSATASPASLTVAQFLAKASALKAKGMLAIGSPDIALLRDSVKSSATSYRAEIAAAKQAGRTPRACLPPVGKAKVDGGSLMADFNKIPVAERGMSVKSAFYQSMDRRYPCRP